MRLHNAEPGLPETDSTGGDISWSSLFQHRKQAARRLGSIYELPLAKRLRDVLLREIGAQRANTEHPLTVLELGAGARKMSQYIGQRFDDVEYQSLDIDPLGQHEYRDWRDVHRSFDLIFAFEVIEHLPVDAIPGWLLQIAEHLEPGGQLLLSTPNTYYPPAFLRDVTHRTPLCYDELAGLVAASGLAVDQVVRIYHDPLPRRVLRQYLLGWLFRAIGLDFAHQIALVAHREPAQTQSLPELRRAA